MKVYNILLILSLAVALCSCSEGDSGKSLKKNERYYQVKICEELSGQVEYVLFDKTRVDCLTNDYAIEVDWAKKWAEGIGQSLYYAAVTGKKPAVGLIVSSDKKDQRHLKRLKVVADELNIKIIVIDKE